MVGSGAATATRCRQEGHRRGRSRRRRPRRENRPASRSTHKPAPIAYSTATVCLPSAACPAQWPPIRQHSNRERAKAAADWQSGSLRALPPIVPPCSRKHRLVRTGTLQRLALSPSSRRGQLQHPPPIPAGERHHAQEPTSALRRSRRCGRWPPFFHSPRHSFSLSESLARVPTLKSVRRMLIPRRGRAPDDALAARASAAPAPSSRALVRGGSSS